MSVAELLENVEHEINEAHAMIDNFVKVKNAEEVKYWRGVLQYCKRIKIQLKEGTYNGPYLNL